MDFSGSNVKGGRDYMGPPNEGKDYKWYISGIYVANWVIIYYLPPFTFEPEKSIEYLGKTYVSCYG